MRASTVTCPECSKSWEIPGTKIKPKVHCSCGAIFKPHGSSTSPAMGPRPAYAAIEIGAIVLLVAGILGVVVGGGLFVYALLLGDVDSTGETFRTHVGPVVFAGLVLIAISQLFRLFLDVAGYLWEMTNILRQISKTTRPQGPAKSPLDDLPPPPKL